MIDLSRLFYTAIGFTVVHLVVLRVVGPVAFIRNGVILLVGLFALPGLPIAEKLVFASLWNMYMFALICARNSVSLRILDEIGRAPGEELTKVELLERFSDAESLSARIDLMEKNAFLRTTRAGEIELTRKGRGLAWAILFARKLFGVPNVA